MCPSEAIQTLDTLVEQLQKRLDQVRQEAKVAQECWRGLKHMTGAREDDAVELMRMTHVELVRLTNLAVRCEQQLQDAIHMPWQEESA